VTTTEISPEEKRHVDETANLYRVLSPSVPDRHAHFDIQLAGASDAVGNEASPVSLVVGCFIKTDNRSVTMREIRSRSMPRVNMTSAPSFKMELTLMYPVRKTSKKRSQRPPNIRNRKKYLTNLISSRRQ